MKQVGLASEGWLIVGGSTNPTLSLGSVGDMSFQDSVSLYGFVRACVVPTSHQGVSMLGQTPLPGGRKPCLTKFANWSLRSYRGESSTYRTWLRTICQITPCVMSRRPSTASLSPCSASLDVYQSADLSSTPDLCQLPEVLQLSDTCQPPELLLSWGHVHNTSLNDSWFHRPTAWRPPARELWGSQLGPSAHFQAEPDTFWLPTARPFSFLIWWGFGSLILW